MTDSLLTVRFPVKHSLLKKYIKHYWLIETQMPVEIHHKLLPVNSIDFIFNLSTPIHYIKKGKPESVYKDFHFNGIMDKYSFIKQNGSLKVLGISFLPTGPYPFLNIPLSEFKNRTTD